MQDWALELEDVFVVERAGEDESYTPFKKSLDNHMLLWHGQLTSPYVFRSNKFEGELELTFADDLQVLELQIMLVFLAKASELLLQRLLSLATWCVSFIGAYFHLLVLFRQFYC